MKRVPFFFSRNTEFHAIVYNRIMNHREKIFALRKEDDCTNVVNQNKCLNFKFVGVLVSLFVKSFVF